MVLWNLLSVPLTSALYLHLTVLTLMTINSSHLGIGHCLQVTAHCPFWPLRWKEGRLVAPAERTRMRNCCRDPSNVIEVSNIFSLFFALMSYSSNATFKDSHLGHWFVFGPGLIWVGSAGYYAVGSCETRQDIILVVPSFTVVGYRFNGNWLYWNCLASYEQCSTLLGRCLFNKLWGILAGGATISGAWIWRTNAKLYSVPLIQCSPDSWYL